MKFTSSTVTVFSLFASTALSAALPPLGYLGLEARGYDPNLKKRHEEPVSSFPTLTLTPITYAWVPAPTGTGSAPSPDDTGMPIYGYETAATVYPGVFPTGAYGTAYPSGTGYPAVATGTAAPYQPLPSGWYDIHGLKPRAEA